MKEPVSLDLFPDDVLPSFVASPIIPDHLVVLRDKLRFYIISLTAKNAYARHVASLRSMWARQVLEQLGGLGGVW